MNAQQPPRRRGRPPRISGEQILAAALALVDANGLEALTMRRLGTQLGVDPMTLYAHVPDKAALQDALIERVLTEIRVPAPTGDWARDFRAVARSARETLLAHPATVVLLGTRPLVTAPAFMVMESVIEILLAGGLGEAAAADGFDCLGRLLVGHVLAEVGQPPGAEQGSEDEDHRQAQADLPGDRYPALARVRRAGVNHDPERLFEFELEGLVRALAARSPEAR